jgi:hypothetical protein
VVFKIQIFVYRPNCRSYTSGGSAYGFQVWTIPRIDLVFSNPATVSTAVHLTSPWGDTSWVDDIKINTPGKIVLEDLV